MSETSQPNGQSWLRQISSQPVNKVAHFVDDHFPSVTPDHLTYLGVALVGLGAAAIGFSTEASFHEYVNQLRLLGVAGIGLGSVLDGFDGALARIKAARGEHNTRRGQITDAVTDRYVDSILAALRLWVAHSAGSEFAQGAALAAWVSNLAPSYLRAWAESQGVVVPEGGNNLVQFAGTRAGRMLANYGAIIAGLAGLPAIQGSLDAVSSIANTTTALARWRLGRHVNEIGYDNLPEEQRLLPEKMQLAEERRQALAQASALSLSAALGAAGVNFLNQ